MSFLSSHGRVPSAWRGVTVGLHVCEEPRLDCSEASFEDVRMLDKLYRLRGELAGWNAWRNRPHASLCRRFEFRNLSSVHAAAEASNSLHSSRRRIKRKARPKSLSR
jgi:hypothetical protein